MSLIKGCDQDQQTPITLYSQVKLRQRHHKTFECINIHNIVDGGLTRVTILFASQEKLAIAQSLLKGVTNYGFMWIITYTTPLDIQIREYKKNTKCIASLTFLLMVIRSY